SRGLQEEGAGPARVPRADPAPECPLRSLPSERAASQQAEEGAHIPAKPAADGRESRYDDECAGELDFPMDHDEPPQLPQKILLPQFRLEWWRRPSPIRRNVPRRWTGAVAALRSPH